MAYVTTYRLSLCQCCMLVSANGECCDQDHGTDNYPVPLSAIPDTDSVTLGLLYAEHNERCLFRRMESNAPNDYECDCEDLGFSWSSCDGCGGRLAGSRFAATGWENDKVGV